LRQRAQEAGNLQSNENVRVEPQGQTIVIEQANPQIVYVPYYNPTVVYGPWWYPEYPPVYWGPWPGYYARPGFGAGFFWGAGITIGTGFFFGAFDWPHRHATVVNINNYYYRPPTRVASGPAGGWYHDPVHRRGVPYRDPGLRQEFGRYSARPEARREFRGNQPGWREPSARPDPRNVGGRPQQRDVNPQRPNMPDGGRPEPRSVPRTNPGTAPSRPVVPGAESSRVQNRPVAPNRSASDSRPHVFEGVGQGPVVRDSSQRGNNSAQRVAPMPSPAGQTQPQRAAPAARQNGNARPSAVEAGQQQQQQQQHR
jgi:hypothetical protein